MPSKEPVLYVGQTVDVDISSEHNGELVIFEHSGVLVRKLANGNFILRLDGNGLEAEVSPSQARARRKDAK